MTTKPATNKKLYLINALVFLIFGAHFFILNDLFFTGLLIFTSLLNLIAFFQISKKVSDQSIFTNFFNGFLLFISSYNYGEFNQKISLFVCGSISVVYIGAAIRQYYLRAIYRKEKKRKLKKFR